MHWSFWFAAQWRGVSMFFICFLLAIGLLIARLLGGEAMQTQSQSAKANFQQALHQQKIAQQQYDLWHAKRIALQYGLRYIVTANTPTLAGLLQTWQEASPERKLRFELESMETGSNLHDKKVRHAQRLQLGFWVRDEEDLSEAWMEKKALPCLFVMQSAQLTRAEEGGIWVEEDAVCVQF